MSQRKVGAAIVIDPEQPGPGILTERDLLESLGEGQDPDTETWPTTSPAPAFAAPDWSLERAAEAMVRGGFRHLVIVDGGETVGVLSMRDIVRCWTGDGASCEVPEGERRPAAVAVAGRGSRGRHGPRATAPAAKRRRQAGHPSGQLPAAAAQPFRARRAIHASAQDDPADHGEEPRSRRPPGYRHAEGHEHRKVGGVREVNLLGGLRQASAGLGISVPPSHGLVDRRGDEGRAEHEEADRSGDQRGADVLLGESAVHGELFIADPVPESDKALTSECAREARG